MINEHDEYNDVSPRTPNNKDHTITYDDSSSIRKVVIKRPFLARGSGKAGGLGS